MGYEDIEPPTPEVDRLYREIVSDYKAGKYISQENALGILECQYIFSYIEIKEVMSKDFETYPFYLWGTIANIDEYIKVCEKSEISPSSKERDIYVGIIDEIIKRIEKSDEEGDDPEFMRSYNEIAQLVYIQVEKVRNLCRKNRETKELYKKYKAEIENITEIQQQTKQDGYLILRDLEDEGQLKYENGKYIPYKSIPDFISWCKDNGYIDDGEKKNKYKDDLTPEFFFEKIKHDCTLETIKRYFRDAKMPRKVKNVNKSG